MGSLICCCNQAAPKKRPQDTKQSINMLSTAYSLSSYLDDLPNAPTSSIMIDGTTGMIYYPDKETFCSIDYLPKIPGKAIQTENNMVLIVGAGGFPFVNTYKVDLIHQRLIKLDDLNQGRFFHALANLKNKIYAIGGCLSGMLKSVEMFDGDNWIEVEPMSLPREHHSATTCNDKIYVFAGDDLNDGIEEYDGKRWMLLPVTLPVKIREIGLCSFNDSIYIVGGYRFVLSKLGDSNRFWRFDVKDQRFEELQNFPYADCFEDSGIYTKGDMHFIGKKNAYVYDAEFGNWRVIEKKSACIKCRSSKCKGGKYCPWSRRKLALLMFKYVKIEQINYL